MIEMVTWIVKRKEPIFLLFTKKNNDTANSHIDLSVWISRASSKYNDATCVAISQVSVNQVDSICQSDM